MSIEALLAQTIEALDRNTAATLTLAAGRDEAIEQLKASQAAEASKPARTSRKKADEPAAATTPAPTPTPEPEVTRTMRQVDYSEDGVKALAGKFIQQDTDKDAMQTRAGQVVEMCKFFKSPKVAGPESTLTDETRYMATFFLERMLAGLPIDYMLDYDFDGDPLFDKPEGAPVDDILG